MSMTVDHAHSVEQKVGSYCPPPQPKLVLNKVAILLKRELTLDLVEEALKILMYLQENLLGKDIFR